MVQTEHVQDHKKDQQVIEIKVTRVPQQAPQHARKDKKKSLRVEIPNQNKENAKISLPSFSNDIVSHQIKKMDAKESETAGLPSTRKL